MIWYNDLCFVLCTACAKLTSDGTQFCYDLFTPYDISNATFYLENPTVDCGVGNEFKTRTPPTPVCVNSASNIPYVLWLRSKMDAVGNSVISHPDLWIHPWT